MRNRLLALLAALLLAIGAPIPASADTPGCVSDGEYSNTVPGEKMSSVHARFDTDGTLTSTRFADGWRYQVREYLRCPSADVSNRVHVEYRQDVSTGELSGPNTVVRKWRSTE